MQLVDCKLEIDNPICLHADVCFQGLDDLCVRFIINLPREELESVERICFQVEEAQWFYEDFIRPLDPALPSLNLRQFCLMIFQHCPLFTGYNDEVFSAAFSEFLAYKTRVPVRGAIMLNESMDAAVLVKGWKKSASWSFPRGKINKDEKDLDCAIREVYEETGYDINAAGLVHNRDEVKSIEITMREQHMKLFIFPRVPMDTHFEPRTRKEISKIQWYKLSDLPALKKTKNNQQQQQQHLSEEQELSKNASKFYMVAPFMGPLKKHIAQLRKQDTKPKPVVELSIPQQPLESVPVQETVVDQKDDLGRLMAQLRQSQQASREHNYPEVTGTEDAMKEASVQLKDLLHLPVEVPATPISDDSAAREIKAQAMLSLLRGGPVKRESVELPPETPFDKIINEPLLPPPFPKGHPHRVARAPMFPTPQAFPFSLPQLVSHQGRPAYVSQPRIPGPPLRPQEFIDRPDQPSHLPNGQPPMWRQEQGNPQGTSFLGGDRQAMAAPAANQLPKPKPNAHSSKLLDLFRQAPSPPSLTQLPAELSRPEPSILTPLVEAMSQTPTIRSGPGENIRSSYALASSSTGLSLRSSQKTPSQQETLLSLFKGSAFAGKPSPSLASPPAAVELSASLEPLHVNTLQAAPIIQASQESRPPIRNISPLTEDERSFKAPSTGGLDLSPDLSATVTGPLAEIQFDGIKSPEHKAKSNLQQSPKHLSPRNSPRRHTKTGVPQQIRILSRPSSSHVKPTPPALDETYPPRSKRTSETKELPTERPVFQPQILKRQAVAESPTIQNLPSPAPKSTPLQILSRPKNPDSTPSHKQPNRADNHQAQLLALFGARPTDTSPIMSATALPLSPLSKQPQPQPEPSLPSPLFLSNRSRIGSIQSNLALDQPYPLQPSILAPSGRSTPKPATTAGIPPASGRNTPRATSSIVTSPVDRNFLLGFLDDVAKEVAR